MSLQRTIARNTLFNAGGRVWEAGISLVLTWYIVGRVDTSGWGLWSLVGAFVAYASLFDFGVASGFAKYIAEHTAKEDSEALSATITTGACFYLLFGIVAVAVGWPVIDLLMDSIVAPRAAAATGTAPDLEGLRFLLRGALAIFVVNTIFAPFAALPVGLQRMGISNLLSAASSLVKCAATVLFLEAGYGVPGLLYASAAMALFTGITGVALGFWLAPGLRIGPRHVQWETFKTLFAFGWRAQVAKFANLINFQTDRLVIVWFYANLQWVGLYRLGEELAGKMRQLPALLVTALLPAASDLDARDRQDALRRLYLVSTKYMASISVPLTAYFCANAGVLMHAWLGARPGLNMAAWTLRILAVGYLANLLPGPGVSIVLGKGRADVPMYAGIISTVANIALTLSLVFLVGFYGIPIGTTLGMFISTSWFFRVMHRTVGVGAAELLRVAAWWPMLASLPGIGFGLAAEWITLNHPGHLPNLMVALLSAALFGLSYLFIIGRTPFLDAFDVSFLEDTLRVHRLPGYHWLTWRARHV
jgi:O-antigen/teichoic acid export membrane protein